MQRSIRISFSGTVLLVLIAAISGLSQGLKQRENLLTRLKQSRPDTNRVNILLDLGRYYLDKAGDFQADADSATNYMKQAEKLSSTLISKLGKPTPNHINVLLKLSEFYCFKPQELLNDTDSAIYYAKQAGHLSQLIHSPLAAKALRLTGNAYFEKHDSIRAQNYFMQAIKQCEQRKDTLQLALVWEQLGERTAHSKQNLLKKVDCYKKAFTYFHHLKNQDKELQLVDYIYYSFFLQQRTDLALMEMQAILRVYTAEKYALTDFIYLIISAAELTLGNYQAAMQNNLKSLQLVLPTNQFSRIGENYNHLGKICFYMNDDDKRLYYYKQGLYYHKKVNDLNQIHSIAKQICQLLIKKKKATEAYSFHQNILRQYPPTSDDLKIQSYQTSAELYEAIKQYNRAESYYLRLLDLTKNINEQDLVKRGVYGSVGKFYMNQKQFTKARYYFTKLLSLNSRSKNTKEAQVNQYNLFKLDSAQGNFQSALAHLQQYTALKDSTLTATKAKQIEELQIQYESQNKEHRIDLLTIQAREQQARVQQANLTRNVTFGGAIMLLLLLGLIYNRYRLKQTQQAEIQLKNQALEDLVGQKEWLLKEIHHRVKNNLQLIISLLQSQGKYLLDKNAVSAIEQSEHRVRAMALIHQKLYRSENLSQIDMRAYIQEVARQLGDSFDPQGHISFHYELASLDMDVSQAIPLGLIVNEAITNAFKYAFPNDQSGSIQLFLSKIEADRYLLQVKDDGVGLPEGLDLKKSNSMGANIMRGLSKQLGGVMQVKSSLGVEISVPFTLVHLQPSAHHA